ncbi:DNA-methyltransferase [Methanogenium organophilum]|uniref:Type II methyltransferase n=1 Tax=Methanogenium organophilum TaxID=2199 RepID=A0A9X9S4Y9_METOG|nr:site-specific DNA-methyltransferase [Methanogenium organophilum]WAI01817.1 site-specific DNA-methyltransferase [Methanogenium organophilum]
MSECIKYNEKSIVRDTADPSNIQIFDKTGPQFQIIQGDALTSLKNIQSNIFQCCITSPPYWGLRDYGINGQIGAEPTLDEYITNIVEIFREVRRVLTDDGTLWINIGDTYTSGNRKWRDYDRKNSNRGMNYRFPTPEGLKQKDLIGLPWRIAFELQKDGWFLRSDIIWHKTNCQPESVKDRPTKSHEYLFLLTKSPNYYYDYESIREPTKNGKGLRNKRTVWSIPTESNKFAHVAMFNKALVEPCIKAGSKEGDLLLDPFFGSGTMGIVALELNRNVVGIELNPDYVNIAANRLCDSVKRMMK